MPSANFILSSIGFSWFRFNSACSKNLMDIIDTGKPVSSSALKPVHMNAISKQILQIRIQLEYTMCIAIVPLITLCDIQK